MRWAVLVAAAIPLVALVPAASGAGLTYVPISIGDDYSTNISLPPGDHAAFSFHGAAVDTVTVRLYNGPADVYWMEPTEYEDYAASGILLKSGLVHSGLSRENTTDFGETALPPFRDLLVLLVDNSNASASGAPGTVTVRAGVNIIGHTQADPPFLIFCGIPLLIFGVSMVFIVRSALRNKARLKREGGLATQQQPTQIRAHAGDLEFALI